MSPAGRPMSCRGPLSPAEGSLSPGGHGDQGVGGLLNRLTLYLHLDVSIARNDWYFSMSVKCVLCSRQLKATFAKVMHSWA